MEKNNSNEEGVTNQKGKDNQEQQLVLFRPQVEEMEDEKHHLFLLWLGDKKVLLTTLMSMFFLVGSIFVLFSYKWIVASKGDKRTISHLKVDTSPAHIILYLKDKSFSLDLKKIGFDGRDISTLDKWELRTWLEQVKKRINIPAVNADQTRMGARIKPERIGSIMDEKQLYRWLRNPEDIINKPQQILMITQFPTVTKAILQQVGKKEISSYTTFYDSKNITRTNNMRIASKSINNLILLPGEFFSFNKMVGERTMKKGYRVTRTIVKGEYSEGIGGGICQVSSTLFNSVDEAGLSIIRRYSINSQVTFVPSGRDATVSWGGPDFRFKNNLESPILLRVKLQKGKLIISTFSVPDVKIISKKVKEAPLKISHMVVKGNKPTSNLNGKG
ncbi:VanW family protein [Shimazuella kribbensis]|uniref:VanW family protein n=1 Tax=Shimazuella kribbensis TaxID=139808 RepID=UPI0003FD2C7A|nr:VanW family protein [Shimazuella kribbensis]